MQRRFRLIYGTLVLVRIIIALNSTSYIHPDEHFQNPEVAASLTYDYSNTGDEPFKTWEWTADSPCRSIAPVLGSTGAAFALLRAIVGSGPSAHALFLAERATMLVLSFAIDLLIWLTSHSRHALLLVAASPVIFTFLLRPFSNSLETVLLALAYYLCHRFDRRSSIAGLALLGSVCALGIFVRITFVAFVAPVLAATAWQLIQSEKASTFRLANIGFPACLTFVATSIAFVASDTAYFNPTNEKGRGSLVLTPLNLLRYNMSHANLAEHGIHPRYLHLLVNLPMLFGAGPVIIASAVRGRSHSERKEKTSESFARKVYLSGFVFPVALLSLQPHQEPRFLLPLLIPLALLVPFTSLFRKRMSRAMSAQKVVWTLWLIHSLLFTIFFGFLHQGGVVPASLALNADLRDPTTALGRSAHVNIVFWRTFMPPRHLLLPLSQTKQPPPPVVRVTDLAGSPPGTLSATLTSLHSRDRSLQDLSMAKVVLAAPAYAVDTHNLTCNPAGPTFSTNASDGLATWCLQPLFGRKTFGIHVDTDRLGELAQARRWGRTGLGIWEVVRVEGRGEAAEKIDRPSSRASTIRAPEAHHPAADSSDREDFLSSALARLNLTPRPPTPALNLGALGEYDEDDDDVSSSDGPKTMQTLGSVTSPATRRGSMQTGASGTFVSLSGSRTSGTARQSETSTLLSVEDASDIVHSFFVNSDRSSGRTGSEKLLFFQALVVQFAVCRPSKVPSSIKNCVKLLRQVHISIRQYLNVVQRGGDVATEVQRFRSKAELRDFLCSGKRKKKLVALDTAKSEMLTPFLIELY
ncbi:hypothetical protein JCM11641_004719 [Rhodosporidiobolus odoratus]